MGTDTHGLWLFFPLFSHSRDRWKHLPPDPLLAKIWNRASRQRCLGWQPQSAAHLCSPCKPAMPPQGTTRCYTSGNQLRWSLEMQIYWKLVRFCTSHSLKS